MTKGAKPEKPTVFVGSSLEQIAVAKAIARNLNEVARIDFWKDSFPAGQYLLRQLISISERVDFAVIVLNPDDAGVVRNQEYSLPRDNVVFELGLFVGALGQERVFAIMDKHAETRVMSDYGGIRILTYDLEEYEGNLARALRPVCAELDELLLSKTPRPRETGSDSLQHIDRTGLLHVYDTYDLAEPEILSDLKVSKGPIRLFFHIASQNVGAKGSLFDILRDLTNKGEAEIRILHSSKRSPYFSCDRLKSLGKDPVLVLDTLQHVENALDTLQKISTGSLRHRAHDYPFIWRLYAFDQKLYLMPYYADKDATKKSPVLAFENRSLSLYHVLVEWFDYEWNRFAPAEISMEDIITPATPSGAALFIRWDGWNVFGIPERDANHHSDYLRFYGLGGKRHDSRESLTECALREGNEESGGAVSGLISSGRTDFFRSDGTIEEICLVVDNDIRPRLVFEKKQHSGFGSMKIPDAPYYMVGYNAEMARKPTPSGELAALLFLTDEHLLMFARRTDITVDDVIKYGGHLEERCPQSINRRSILVPWGLASYLTRVLS